MTESYSALAFRKFTRLALALSLLFGCADRLPDDLADYRNDCVRMNDQPLPERDDDPHLGSKNVYACNVAMGDLEENNRPFPDGAIIVKESLRADSSYVWLVATARKQGGTWHWNEYTRNFEDEEFAHIPSGESVCIDCHRDAESIDWIFTPYTAGP